MAGYPNYQYNPQQNGMANMTSPMGMNTAATTPFNQQFVFPQPIGSVYNLNTAADIGNIPTGANITVGLCLNENILQVKTLQNGVPSLLSYRLSPIEGQGTSQPEAQKNNTDNYAQIIERLERIENLLFTKPSDIKSMEPNGGRLDWQV
jgi:hypothetical protein